MGFSSLCVHVYDCPSPITWVWVAISSPVGSNNCQVISTSSGGGIASAFSTLVIVEEISN